MQAITYPKRAVEEKRRPVAPLEPFTPAECLVPHRGEGHLPFLGGRQHLAAEQFRLMASRLNANQPSGGVMLITSAVPADGKTLTAANLSCALAERSRTLLLELDLRRPTLRKLLGLEDYRHGILPVLQGQAPAQTAVSALFGVPLHLALCSEPSSDVRRALQGPELPAFLSWARRSYHWVVIDTPPVVPISDVSEIAPLCDAAILVARARHTPVPQLRRSIELLGRRLRYTVLNDGRLSMHNAYQYINSYLESPKQQK